MACSEVAKKEHALFVDQFDPYMAIMLRERAGNPPTMVGGGDAVHPGPIGHTVMAWAVLKGLGASALVSRAAIDASAKKVAATEACRIDNLNVTADNLSFDRLDEALPMPIHDKAEAALKLAPILQDLSRYELKVTGLSAGNYEITIDGTAAGKATPEELASGYNLAMAPGPITEQARSILSLIFKKNDVFFTRWRGIQLYQLPEWARGANIEPQRAAEIARLDEQVADLEKQINAARKPQTHHFEIKRAE